MGNGKSIYQNKITAFALLLLQLTLFDSCNKTGSINEPVERMQTIDTSELFSGDIVFRRGRDFMANVVLSQSDSGWFSHVGILIKNDTGVSVVHAMPNGVTKGGAVSIIPLDDFFSTEHVRHGSIFRLKQITQVETDALVAFALSQVGKPFDHNYLFSTDIAFYCTELVLKSLATVRTEFKTINSVRIIMVDEPVILPDHLVVSEQLEKIKDINPVIKSDY
jgi:hypothetical protein